MKTSPPTEYAGASAKRPLGLFVALFLIVFLLLALMYVALRLNTGIYAYSAGESQWSKGRKDAVHQLERYVTSGEERHYERFERGLAIPLADYRARLEMDRPDFDRQRTFDYFVAGKNHPEFIPMLIHLYRWFHWQPHFARAIDVWVESDQYILGLQALGEKARSLHAAGGPTPEQRRELLAELYRIDRATVPLETAFSLRLGEAARWMQVVLAVTLLLASLGLLTLGGYIIRRTTARVFMVHTFEAEERFSKTFDVAPVGIFLMALDGTLTHVNESMCRMLGEDAEHLLGKRESDFLSPRPSNEKHNDPLFSVPGEENEALAERCYLRADGHEITVQLHVKLVRDIRGRPLYHVAAAHDVTESRRLAQELSYRAQHDSLTGLLNRYEFERQLKAAVRGGRQQDRQCVLFYLDLDQFKVINDTCGHMAGDAMLKRVAAVIRGCLRGSDILARLGGDEFGVLLRSTSPKEGETVAEKVRSEVGGFRFAWGERQFSLGISIGVVPFAGGDYNAPALLSAADVACYAAKESGRNQIRVSQPGDTSIVRHHEEMDWLARLQQAHDDDRFLLVWQPIVSVDYLPDEPPRRFEVLVRMVDVDGSLVLPRQFIPAAERYGQMVALDSWVLATLLDWLAANPEQIPRIDQINVNISGVALSDLRFIEMAKARIRNSAFPAERLCFEVTETMAITNINAAIEFMEALSELGCQFALDDFGVGASSFAYLNALPVHYVKIDGAFVRDIDRNPIHEAIVRCITDVAHSTGKQAIAEFVESWGVLDKLRQLGCEHAQGDAIGSVTAIGDLSFQPTERWRDGEVLEYSSRLARSSFRPGPR